MSEEVKPKTRMYMTRYPQVIGVRSTSVVVMTTPGGTPNRVVTPAVPIEFKNCVFVLTESFAKSFRMTFDEMAALIESSPYYFPSKAEMTRDGFYLVGASGTELAPEDKALIAKHEEARKVKYAKDGVALSRKGTTE